MALQEIQGPKMYATPHGLLKRKLPVNGWQILFLQQLVCLGEVLAAKESLHDKPIPSSSSLMHVYIVQICLISLFPMSSMMSDIPREHCIRKL